MKTRKWLAIIILSEKNRKLLFFVDRHPDFDSIRRAAPFAVVLPEIIHCDRFNEQRFLPTEDTSFNLSKNRIEVMLRPLKLCSPATFTLFNSISSAASQSLIHDLTSFWLSLSLSALLGLSHV
jgi:hypothetical protein